MSPERFDELRSSPASEMHECLDEISRLAAMVYVPGGWHCPKCKFHLVSSVMFMRSGTIGASRQIPDPCPNDGTPMEPDTWEEEARQMAEMMPDANCMARINRLRADEGASVNILCDNPDGPPNCAIEVCDGWTAYEPRQFWGDTLMEALGEAERAKGKSQRPT